MTGGSILAVPGLARMSPAFVWRLWEICQSNGWDADSVAAVISSESGFRASVRNPQPGQTATGLLQWIESTAQRMGTTTAALARMTVEVQLEYVEKYYRMCGVKAGARRVDFYLAGWGAPQGLRFEHILASRGMRVYDLNVGLDFDRDGFITVQDLDRHLERVQVSAGERRIGAARPLAGPVQCLRESSLRRFLRSLFFLKRGETSAKD